MQQEKEAQYSESVSPLFSDLLPGKCVILCFAGEFPSIQIVKNRKDALFTLHLRDLFTLYGLFSL